jgi:hypothetical protein
MNDCYETARPDEFKTGLSMIESEQPAFGHTTDRFTDLRNYMPPLAFKNRKLSHTDQTDSHIMTDVSLNSHRLLE